MPEFVVEFDQRIDAADDRLDAAAFHRNFEPMLAVLQRVLSGRSGQVLEIGSGTGQHVVEFAKAMPALTWQPTDLNSNHLKSIEAWRRQSGVTNIAPPFALDATDPETWLGGKGRPPSQALAAIVSMNVIHIAPWSVCEGIMRIAGRDLLKGGLLVLYGPFKRGGEHTAPSNAAFDASLRQENPLWGVRDVQELEVAAAERGLRLTEVVEMPANNLTLVFERAE
jgi:SAM-dependent methyltransferase